LDRISCLKERETTQERKWVRNPGRKKKGGTTEIAMCEGELMRLWWAKVGKKMWGARDAVINVSGKREAGVARGNWAGSRNGPTEYHYFTKLIGSLKGEGGGRYLGLFTYCSRPEGYD